MVFAIVLITEHNVISTGLLTDLSSCRFFVSVRRNTPYARPPSS